MVSSRLVVLALGSLLGVAQPAAWAATTVTYVANEAFLIEAGGKKILFDPFVGDPMVAEYCHVPGAETVARIGAAEPPFDGVDLILVTHAHVDHFDPELVLRHLAANPGAVVVAPPPAAAMLRAQPAWAAGYDARVTAPELDLYESRDLTLRGVHVETHRVRHSQYMIRDEASGEMRNKHEGVENHLAPDEALIDTFARQVGERVPTAVVFRKPMERVELRLRER